MADTTKDQKRYDNIEGEIIIEESVVRTISLKAARTIEGIYRIGSAGIKAAFKGTKGIEVDMGEEEVILSLDVIVFYGTIIPNMAKALKSMVAKDIETMTGKVVSQINLRVTDIVDEVKEELIEEG